MAIQPPKVQPLSPDVVIITRAELTDVLRKEYQRGFDAGVARERQQAAEASRTVTATYVDDPTRRLVNQPTPGLPRD